MRQDRERLLEALHTFEHEKGPDGSDELRELLKVLAEARPRWGQDRLHVLVRRQGYLRARVDGAWVELDEGRIGEVVTNLVENAVKFSPPGGAGNVPTFVPSYQHSPASFDGYSLSYCIHSRPSGVIAIGRTCSPGNGQPRSCWKVW